MWWTSIVADETLAFVVILFVKLCLVNYDDNLICSYIIYKYIIRYPNLSPFYYCFLCPHCFGKGAYIFALYYPSVTKSLCHTLPKMFSAKAMKMSLKYLPACKFVPLGILRPQQVKVTHGGQDKIIV